MKSNVQILGHPVHPILVPIAIGAFVTAFIFDIAAVATRIGFWFDASFWALLIGVIAGVLSAITGLYDYFTVPMTDRAKRDATSHLALNVVLMTLFIISLIIKAPSATSAPRLPADSVIVSTFILDLIAVVLLLVSGWYGGEVVYRHGVAVTEEAASEICPAFGGTPIAGTMGGERPADRPQTNEFDEGD